MSEDVRGSEPVMTTKDAILELRGDMKTVLGWIDQQKGANLPSTVAAQGREIVDLKRDRDELKGAMRLVKGAAAVGAALGGLATAMQIFGLHIHI